jgi:hypothetical protein
MSLLLAAVIPVNNTQEPRALGAFYFDSLDESQVWTTVEPEGEGGRPVTLNVTVEFPGRKLTRTPAMVTMRAQAATYAFPTRLRQPILRFKTDRGREYDLTGPGRVYTFVASCEKCANDTVTTKMALDELREIADAGSVTAEAVGFSVTLASADLAALRRLIAAVEGGAVVK